MLSLSRSFSRPCGRALAVFSLCTASAIAQNSPTLHTLSEPGGGEIVYGPVTGQSTLPQAMGFMLRMVHSHFGERPVVGKFFQARGSNSVATFFTVNAPNQGNKHMAGLVIVTLSPGAPPAAAVLYDDATRFSTSVNGLMKRLNQVWQPAAATATQASGSRPAGPAAGPAAPLRQTTFPDNSGSVGLPSGWRITGGGQGMVSAEGPNGDAIQFGVVVPVMDPTNPQQRQMIQMETQGGRIPLPGSYTVYPPGGDPVRAFIAIVGQFRAKNHLPAVDWHFTSTTRLSANCVLATGTADAHDGKGIRAVNQIICPSAIQSGLWMMTLYQTTTRPELAEAERATMAAISSSYRLNNAVINAETQANISAIKQIGIDAKIRTDASNAAFDSKLAGDRANQDTVDRAMQNFSNYQLDRTVVRDSELHERGTVSNGYADSLVRNDPGRYQYVPTQNMLKGIDY